MFLFQTDRLTPELIASSTLRDLRRGQYLYRQGEVARVVTIVLSGRVQLSTITADGRQIPLYTVRAGECVAEGALFADRYCSDVVAETKSRLRVFPNEVLQKTLFNHPELAAEFMTLQAIRCNTLRISLELRSFRSARERILQFLSISTLPQTGLFTLDRPLRNIADDLGLTHESFYRTLRNLSEEGVISRTGSVIRLKRSSLLGGGKTSAAAAAG